MSTSLSLLSPSTLLYEAVLCIYWALSRRCFLTTSPPPIKYPPLRTHIKVLTLQSHFWCLQMGSTFSPSPVLRSLHKYTSLISHHMLACLLVNLAVSSRTGMDCCTFHSQECDLLKGKNVVLLNTVSSASNSPWHVVCTQ